MKKILKHLIVLSLICCAGVLCYLSITNFESEKISVCKKIGNELQDNISAMLCYSEGHSEIAKSETFFYTKDSLKKSENQYYLGVSHIFPDEIITERFAIPLGYKDSKDMASNLGQILDYANYEKAEILILNDWYKENKKIIVAYIIDNDLKTVEFSVEDEAYLGTYVDNNIIYTLINSKNELIISSIDTTNNNNEITNISYSGLVRDRTDLSGSYTLIKNGRLYLGEATYDTKSDTVFSTISMLDLSNKEIYSVTFEDEWIYNLLYNENEIVALFGTGKDDRGYYQNIMCSVVDLNLDVISTHSIMGLPENIDTVNFADRSQIYNDILYTIINDITLGKNHLLAYNIKEKEILFQAELETKMANKYLFDWNFYIYSNNNYYEIS